MKRFSDLTGKEKLVELLRWLLVPAAAVLGVLALGFIAGLLIPPLLAQPPGSPPAPLSAFRRLVLPRILSILVAAGFVIAGAKTAPRFRIPTAVVLAIVWALYSFMSHVLIHLGRGTPHYAHFAVAAVAAASAAAYVVSSEKRKTSSPSENQSGRGITRHSQSRC